MGKIITIDCDNVLCNTTKSFVEYYKIMYGDDIDYNSISQGYLWNNPVFPKFECDDTYTTYLNFCTYVHEKKIEQPLAGSQKIVQELVERGYELHVLTGRMDVQKDMTYAFINEHFPDMFKEIHFTNDKTKYEISKGSVCKNLGSILHLDEFYHYAQSIEDSGTLVLLFDAPWNKENAETKLIKRVSGRTDVLGFLPH